MIKNNLYKCLLLLLLTIVVISCKVPAISRLAEDKAAPKFYGEQTDTINLASLPYQTFFSDKNLVSLIDTALKNNKELLTTLQEIEIAKNNIRFKQGQLLPAVGASVSSGIEKVGRYTSQGAGDASTDITPGNPVPDALTDITFSTYANWEVDIWKKLHNAKKAAVVRYLATVEGKNFLVTNLIAEISNSYYELLAYDNQLAVVKKNIAIQKNALEIVKIQKEAARETELAVQKFRAEVLNSQSLEFSILQNIKETENRINFLLARYPQEIPRDQSDFTTLIPTMIKSGLPSQLLNNRPDIKEAELELAAAKLDVKVARAEFYPSLGISGAVGFQAFKPSFLFKFPESILYSLAGDLAGPLVNRNAINAEFKNADAEQLKALYNYQKTVLNAYMEVANQLSNIDNLAKSYDLKSQEVDALTKSIAISNDLFKSSRADYLEVLLTQRDALSSKLELIETKKQQFNAITNIYQQLGGGWR
ncbi:MAG: TolC family protein [Pelobium sp.]